jgi:hypothetical protein
MAEALRVDGSTVRRWLSGATTIPGPAEVALELMVELSVAQQGKKSDQADHRQE